MELIHFQGLNCYHDCIVTLANNMGLNYTDSFSRLWSEADFRYDTICNVFLTRRMPEYLEKKGMKLNAPCISQAEKESGWADTEYGEFIIIGMDAFLIPWNPLYKIHHGPHYFIVKRENEEWQICFDPTYGLRNMKYSSDFLIEDSYAVIPVKRTEFKEEPQKYSISVYDEAAEVIKNHKELLDYFCTQSDIWICDDEDTELLPAKLADAMLTGRYLYRYFLQTNNVKLDIPVLFYNEKYYKQWVAVKNGFFKAALNQTNRTAYNEACDLLSDIMEKEILFARQIIQQK